MSGITAAQSAAWWATLPVITGKKQVLPLFRAKGRAK